MCAPGCSLDEASGCGLEQAAGGLGNGSAKLRLQIQTSSSVSPAGWLSLKSRIGGFPVCEVFARIALADRC